MPYRRYATIHIPISIRDEMRDLKDNNSMSWDAMFKAFLILAEKDAQSGEEEGDNQGI